MLCLYSYIIVVKGVISLDQQTIQDFIIKKYQDEERTMVHLFVEWCRSHHQDPHQVYQLAYPEQTENPILTEVLQELDDQKPIHIPTNTLLELLQMFGNDELAFVITELNEKLPANKSTL